MRNIYSLTILSDLIDTRPGLTTNGIESGLLPWCFKDEIQTSWNWPVVLLYFNSMSELTRK